MIFSIKIKEWVNVHHEHESAESGRWVTFGDAHMYEFYEEWFCIFEIPIWRLKYQSTNKGIYNVQFDDVTKSIYEK